MKPTIHRAVTALLLLVGALLSASSARAGITLTAAVQRGGSPNSAQSGSLVVLVQWKASPSGGNFEVLRDGRSLASVGGATRYTDAKVSGGQTHTYAVLGWGKPLPGFVFSNTVTVLVSAPPPIAPPVAPPPPIAPTVPTGLAATGVWNANTTAGAGAPEIDLTWQSSAGATGYNLYRGGTLLSSGLTQTQAADLTTTSGQAYSYTVSAVGPGGESAQSAAVTLTAPTPPPPAAPTALTATPKWAASCPVCGGMPMAHIILAWQAVTGAATYNVYRGGALLHSGLTDASDVDMSVMSGQTYSYTVSAVGPGGESAQSSPVSATAPNPPAAPGLSLIAPSNLSVQGLWSLGASSDVLRWDAVPGAVSYNIYQYDTPLVKGVSGTTYTTLSSLVIGAMSYTVTAVDGMGMESIPSAIAMPSSAFDPSSIPSWVTSYWNPTTPDNLTATAQWNNGAPRIALTWQHSGNYYSVYRDDHLIASGLWGLAYYDTQVQSGETHTYSVAGYNNLLPNSETAHSAPVTATAPAGPPALLSDKVQISSVKADDDSAVIFIQPVPGAVDYRVYDVSNPAKPKYAGSIATKTYGLYATWTPEPIGIEWNGIDPAKGADLVVEAVDKFGPFQRMDGAVGPGAMQMDGTMAMSTNGQGDPSDVPNVIAKSDVFHVTCRPRTLTGAQAFFDNFRNSAPLTPVASLDPAIAARASSYYEIKAVENDKWTIFNYSGDAQMTRSFFMGNHFMDTLYDGPTAATMPFSHNNNASLVMMPKATADISGGKVLHVTFEVDAHFDGRRWIDLFVGAAGDPLLRTTPTKLGPTDFPTVSGNLFAWQIEAGPHDVELIQPQPQADGPTQIVQTDLTQLSGWDDISAMSRIRGDGAALANGTAQDLDKRHQFDLYLSKTHYRIVETTPDGMHNIVRDMDFPAGVSLPFDKCQVYFVHEVYHTGNDRPELVQYNPFDPYWSNYRPWGDERHWDNMGQEVLDAFPQ